MGVLLRQYALAYIITTMSLGAVLGVIFPWSITPEEKLFTWEALGMGLLGGVTGPLLVPALVVLEFLH